MANVVPAKSKDGDIIYLGAPSVILVLSSIVRTGILMGLTALGAHDLALNRQRDLDAMVDEIVAPTIRGFVAVLQDWTGPQPKELADLWAGVALLIIVTLAWLVAWLLLRRIARRPYAKRPFSRHLLLVVLMIAVAAVVAPSTTLAGLTGEDFQRSSRQFAERFHDSTNLHLTVAAFGALYGISFLCAVAWFLGDLVAWQYTRYRLTAWRIEIDCGFVRRRISSYELWHVVKVAYRRDNLLELVFGAGWIVLRVIEPRSPPEPVSIGPLPEARRIYDELKAARSAAGREAGGQVVGIQ